MNLLRKLFLLSPLLLFTISPLKAQDYDDYEERRSQIGLDYRTFRVALVPGLSTNGIDAGNFASRYSFNILAGYNGALERGFELGGILNFNKYYVHGGQIAGIGNISGDESAGFQLSGVFNYSGEEMQGINISGAANIADDEMQGIQITGGVNWSNSHTQGIQVSGAGNISKGDMQGLLLSGLVNSAANNLQGIAVSGGVNYADGDLQGIALAGLVNYSEFFQGISAAPINITREFQGIQGGTVNISNYAQGIQFGVINYAKEFDGVPVGLISYYEDGRSDIDIWTSDGGFTNIGVKLGTEEIYNMVSFGFNPTLDRNVWQLGWSIGRLHQYRNHFLYTDFSYFKLNEGDWTSNLNSIFKYRLLFGKELGIGFQIYGGPTLNMLISRVENSSSYTWYRLVDFGAKGRDYVFWIGYSAGIELF